MAGAEVTGTELYDQMSGETTDMTMRQGPDLFQETNFGGTQLPDHIQQRNSQPFLWGNSQPLLKRQISTLLTWVTSNTPPPRILKKFL
jgi:hypothetical protein